jgi:hypothetical protein
MVAGFERQQAMLAKLCTKLASCVSGPYKMKSGEPAGFDLTWDLFSSPPDGSGTNMCSQRHSTPAIVLKD